MKIEPMEQLPRMRRIKAQSSERCQALLSRKNDVAAIRTFPKPAHISFHLSLRSADFEASLHVSPVA
jgi:hypothetical protein